MFRRLYYRARLSVRRRGLPPAMVRVYDSCVPSTRRAFQAAAARERAALAGLAGLAAPRPMRVPLVMVERVLGFRPAAIVAQGFEPGKNLFEAVLDPDERIGVWLHLAEQLAAFRARGFLHTAIEPRKALFSRRPFRAIWVGHAATIPLPSRRRRGGPEDEGVFAAGLLLADGLLETTDADLVGSRWGLQTLKNALARRRCPGLFRVLKSCLSPGKDGSPRSFKTLGVSLGTLSGSDLSGPVRRTWGRLRAPCSM